MSKGKGILQCLDFFLKKKIIVQLSGENITLAENVAIISEGTTGLVTWEAALYFAEWAMENPEVFNCRSELLALEKWLPWKWI